jgi:hypothetical protein
LRILPGALRYSINHSPGLDNAAGERSFSHFRRYIVFTNVSVNEASLVNEARRGSREAFVTLYKRYGTPLFRFAWRMTASMTAAEDVTQECFLALVRGSAFDGSRASLQTYCLE